MILTIELTKLSFLMLDHIKRLIAMLVVYCLGTCSLTAMEEAITYNVEPSVSEPNTLIVRVELPSNHPETRLILRGVSFGIPPQVQNVTCDDQPIKEEETGTWFVPQNGHELRWEIPLIEGKELDISTQQSIKSGESILLSEASALPRLEKCQMPEILKISIEDVKTIHPKPTLREGIPFPKPSEAPLFVLLNFTEVGSLSEGLITLTYLQDSPNEASKLPDMAANMKGLKWLKSILPGKAEESFIIGWCGIPVKKMSAAGAAGESILLVNYPNDGELPLGEAMLLYVPLHEAFHQLSHHFGPKRPTWVEESLASYYGARAIQAALPNDLEQASSLMDRFHKGADAFQDKGLLKINQAVKDGDRSDYGAFYTKGLSFWDEIEKGLQEQGDSLDHHLEALLQMKYDTNANPVDLQEILSLPTKTWASLRKRFLD